MAIYAISDLHLALSADKPMDIFGDRWQNYMQKIKKNWEEEIRQDDCVLIPGDISWAMHLREAYKDFKYLNDLKGLKIMSKGNHDYWWETANKLEKYVREHAFENIHFLHNNSFCYNEWEICGTRGWICPNEEHFTKQDEKIYQRELQRLERSIQHARASSPRKMIVALHYPPVNRNKDMTSGFISILRKYKIDICVYGHLHGDSHQEALQGEYEGIQFYLVSADFLSFKPFKIII